MMELRLRIMSPSTSTTTGPRQKYFSVKTHGKVLASSTVRNLPAAIVSPDTQFADLSQFVGQDEAIELMDTQAENKLSAYQTPPDEQLVLAQEEIAMLPDQTMLKMSHTTHQMSRESSVGPRRWPPQFSRQATLVPPAATTVAATTLDQEEEEYCIDYCDNDNYDNDLDVAIPIHFKSLQVSSYDHDVSIY